MISGDQIMVHAATDLRVRLLGVDAPDAGMVGEVEATAYTRARLKDKPVTLRLEPTQTRNDEHELLAYVFLSDNDNLNLDLIRDGKAYADRRIKHTLASPFEQAETEARKKSRGLWDGLRTEDQPAWRQAWLKAFFEQRRATSRPIK